MARRRFRLRYVFTKLFVIALAFAAMMVAVVVDEGAANSLIRGSGAVPTVFRSLHDFAGRAGLAVVFLLVAALFSFWWWATWPTESE